MGDVALTVELRTPAPPAGDIVAANGTGAPVRLFDTGNSWGDEAWWFELVRGDAVTPVRRLPQTYTRNVPSSRELAPGAAEHWAFELGDGTWDLAAAGDPAGARLVAVYDAPPTPEAEELGILTGPLRSAPVDLSEASRPP